MALLITVTILQSKHNRMLLRLLTRTFAYTVAINQHSFHEYFSYSTIPEIDNPINLVIVLYLGTWNRYCQAIGRGFMYIHTVNHWRLDYRWQCEHSVLRCLFYVLGKSYVFWMCFLSTSEFFKSWINNFLALIHVHIIHSVSLQFKS